MKLEELQGFTDEQLEMIKKVVQGECDSVRTSYTKQIKDLEQYKPKEKSQAEIDLDTRLQALEQKEKAIAQKERETTIQAKLKEKGLSAELSKFLRFDDNNFDTVLDDFNNVVSTTLLNNSYKPTEHKGNADVITKEQFSNMGYNERVALMQSNPTLYNKLSE